MTIPYIGFSNEELKDKQTASSGDVFLCKKCGKLHELESATNQDGTPTELLLFYRCEGKDYLAAVNKKLVIDVIPTVSGHLP